MWHFQSLNETVYIESILNDIQPWLLMTEIKDVVWMTRWDWSLISYIRYFASIWLLIKIRNWKKRGDCQNWCIYIYVLYVILHCVVCCLLGHKFVLTKYVSIDSPNYFNFIVCSIIMHGKWSASELLGINLY